MSTTGSPLNITEMAAGEFYPHATFNAAMAILNRGGRVDEAVANEVSITTTATLDATAFGKTHIITGTSADYTITLFTPVTADLGKIIGFRVSNAGTKIYTIDAAGAETIDGELTLALFRNDVVYLKAISTSSWQVTGRKGARAAARVLHNANQSIANITVTPLALNTERFDTDTIHDTSTNNTRLTCKTPGIYQITGHVQFAANAVGVVRVAQIRLNGATVIANQQKAPTGGAAITAMSVGTLYSLIVGDYIELCAYQDSGGALNVEVVGNYSPEFGMARIG